MVDISRTGGPTVFIFIEPRVLVGRFEKCKNWGPVTPSFRNFGGQRSNFHLDFLVNRSRFNIITHGDDIFGSPLYDIVRSRSPYPWINVKVSRKVDTLLFDWMSENEDNFFYFQTLCSTS